MPGYCVIAALKSHKVFHHTNIKKCIEYLKKLLKTVSRY
ncbi:Hypothetical protein ABZS17I87_01886 [Kosakonia cowanii]